MEVGTPGVDNVLSRDRDFETYKGFVVSMTTSEPFKKYGTLIEGVTLNSRSDKAVKLNLKGRARELNTSRLKRARIIRFLVVNTHMLRSLSLSDD
jgi:ribosome maturation factor RimP